MSKICKNCDHYKVCLQYNDDALGEHAEHCLAWNGWRDAETDPPKEVKEYICAVRYASTGEYSVNKIIYGPGYRERRTFTVVAWRELPEYEV